MEKIYDYDKVRKLLGKDYHLCLKFDDDNVRWILYREYDDPEIYFSKDNKPIMTSETNTYEELLEYAKKHKKYDLGKVLMKTLMIVSWLLFVLVVLNIIFFNSDIIRGVVFGADIAIVLVAIIQDVVFEHNNYIEILEIEERIEKY